MPQTEKGRGVDPVKKVTVNALFVAFTLEMTKKMFDGLAAMAALGGGMCPAWI